jgi:type VI secretion system lysozyme-like protein
MSERRLLEQISYWESGAIRTNKPQLDILTESVVSYLRRILNTRQGSSPINDKFGVPDFTNIGIGGLDQGSLVDVSDEIARMINQFEPRFKAVKVSIAQSDLMAFTLNFEVSGELQLLDQVQHLKIHAVVGGNGKVEVRN